VRIFLYGRYLGRRLAPAGSDGLPRAGARSPQDVELLAVARDLSAVFDDGDRAEQRRELEQRARAPEGLTIAIKSHRSAFDGSRERLYQQMRQRYAGAF